MIDGNIEGKVLAWYYERQPHTLPTFNPIVRLERMSEDAPGRGFWIETPLVSAFGTKEEDGGTTF